MSQKAIPIYEQSPQVGECLRQGEVLSNIVRFVLDASSLDYDAPTGSKMTYPFVVVLSQSCDLAQDFKTRKEGKQQLPDVLLCHVPTAEELRATPGLNSTIWDKIKKNKDERYHFMERTPSECDMLGLGLPELCADFKLYFSLPTSEVYSQLQKEMAKRRTVLTTPYVEHINSRFAYFVGRIGLPRDHVSE